MSKRYVVRLNETEQAYLEQLVKTGNGPARKLLRAWILLKSNANEDGSNWAYEQICQAYNVSQGWGGFANRGEVFIRAC